ncbi:MAG: methyl-accepting chemotaxis protein [Anaerolineae bacterium]|nr:methyl-accepting chemotaxis protein [Anaerolineae bacterium]
MLLKAIFKSPVFKDDVDKTRIAGSLNVILWIMFCASTLTTFMARDVGQLIGGVAVLLTVGLWSLMQFGYVRISGILLSVILFGLATVSIYFSGTIRTGATGMYILAIICATLFAGNWPGLVLTGLSLLVSFGLWRAELHTGWLPTPELTSQSSTFTNWVALAMAFTMSMVVLWLVNASLNRALEGLRTNERMLEARNRELQATQSSLERHNTALQAAVAHYGAHLIKISQGNLSERLILDESKEDDPLLILGHELNAMTASLQTMAKAAEQMAEGDLTTEVVPQSEQDALGNAFAQMIRRLRELVGQVQRGATEVTTASQDITSASEQSAYAIGQVATTMQQIAQGAAQQSESMTRTTTTVQQVSHAIEGVARGAQEQGVAVTQSVDITTHMSAAISSVVASAQTGAEGASQAARTASDGAETIEATIAGMATIKRVQDEALVKVQEMGERSEQIGLIVETIGKIADQTNLLALNAAIEAARAGEHGKGFAVVADEVRRLAENSARAASEIAILVRAIQKTVAEAVQAMHSGVVEVDAGVVRARESGRALSNILTAVEAVNQQMGEIATAAQQMNVLSERMVRAIEAVSAVVEENTAATEEMATSAEDVLSAVEGIAGISEEQSASTEEVSASVEEVSAQAEEVTAAAETLQKMAHQLQHLVAQFKLPDIK